MLREAVAHAADLSPHVVGALERMVAGWCPYPHEANLIFFGVHVLAAARRHEVWRPLLRALACPDPERDYVFEDTDAETLPALALSLCAGDVEPLIELIENRDAGGFVRWNLFNALTRLTHDGVVSRERMLAVIDRFDRERLAPDGDVAWEGWFDAIVWLDLASHADRIRVAARDGRGPEREIDIKEWEAQASQLGNQTGLPPEFEQQKLQPINDVVAALDRYLPEPQSAAEFSQKDEGATDEENTQADQTLNAEDEENIDPAADIALTDAEFYWLGTFLRSRQVPKDAMSLAHLDGFLCAVAVGPIEVHQKVWVEAIWGEKGGRNVFADEAQARFFADLLKRHARSIVRRLHGLYGHEPVIHNARSRTAITEWACGFLKGMELAEVAWRPLMKRRRAATLLAPILYAATGDASIYRTGFGPLDEDDHLADLTQALLDLADYWRQPPELRGPPQPIRVVPKPGRNQPCPCGSGKKYKRCCGSELGTALS